MAAIKVEWIEALSLHCDVAVIEEDFDFDQVCDAVEPDLVIFEMISWPRPEPLAITNIRSHARIPRAGILNGDPHEVLRAVFFNLLQHYGARTIFSFGLHHHQHMPELCGVDCYALPIFVDGTVFRDYGLDKIIPVSVFGGHMAPSFYPWRAEVAAAIQHVFPTLVYPHPGYRKDEGRAFAVHGTDYARLINQSRFSIADTTRLDYVVRKHLEIPGAGCVMVAPPSPALEDYGFVDMANCIMGRTPDIYAKIEVLSRDPARYDAVRQNGFDLVHSHYTRNTWTSILDWLACLDHCRPGQVVRQTCPMGPFEAVESSSGRTSVGGTIRASPMSAVLGRARDAILAGRDLDTTYLALQQVSAWLSNMAEPIFLMSLITLLHGDPIKAATRLGARAEELGKFGLILGRLDPCEAAWLLLIARLISHQPLAEALTEQSDGTCHLALRRVRWLLDAEQPYGDDLEGRLEGDQLSVHWIGQESFDVWRGLMERVLDANGARDIKASMLRRLTHERTLALSA